MAVLYPNLETVLLLQHGITTISTFKGVQHRKIFTIERYPRRSLPKISYPPPG